MRLLVFVFTWLLCAAMPALAAPGATPPPASAFFNNPGFTGGVLSPNGRYLAAKVAVKTGRDALVVVDLDDNSVSRVAGFIDVDIGEVQWVNDERLLFNTTDRQLAVGAMRYAPGLYTALRDGSMFRQLAERTNPILRSGNDRRMLPWHTYMMDSVGKQDSDFVHVRNISFNGNRQEAVELLRLNTATGRTTRVAAPFTAIDWMLDHDGEPRLATSWDEGVVSIWLRDRATGQWRTLTTFKAYINDGKSFHPLGFGPDGTLYATAYQGQDHRAVHTVDQATGAVSARPVLRVQDFDFSGELIANSQRLLGLRYLGEAYETEWFDPGFKAIQASVDAQLPNTINLLTVPRSVDAKNVLVTAFSDAQPKAYFVYNTATRKLSQAGMAHEQIRAGAMGHQHVVSYTARDGLKIPAMLTLPPGVPPPAAGQRPARLPMVVLVHGGPYVRGSRWEWDPEVQFLASRGYAVLQPEFRGSTGFGRRHFAAGLKQWGLAMQDDIADGARWAIAQGHADPARICIAGASYGGYATLMGLIRDPALYQCGINWVGVTDINLMYTGNWRYASDVPQEFKRYGMPQLIGDPVKDAEQLKATSPLEQAARIRQPLLLAYGTADERVPMVHGTRFRDAVRATNSNVEWVEYQDEGHGWALPQTRIDFWTRVERFLERHIGTGAAGPAP